MYQIANKHFVYKAFMLFSFTFVTAQSLQDLQKLKTEYEKFEKDRSKIVLPSDNIGQQANEAIGVPQRAAITPYFYQSSIDSLKDKINHFGYNFFNQRDTLSFWENLPAPSNYLLGPGDELVVSLWGEAQLRKTYIISRDGTIYDETVGLLDIMGKNIKEAEGYLKDQYGRIYSTLKGNKQSTYIDVSLGKLRSINVNFVGEVNFPGIHPVHPFSTVITGLIQAGGVDTTGTLRKIQIKREGEVGVEIDFYDYLIKGQLSENIQLRDNDIVFVPVRSSTVTVDSAVFRRGIYESISGETIQDMINYAGGLKSNSSSKIGLERIIPPERRLISRSNFENYYLDFQSSQITPTNDGDKIIVHTLIKSLFQVEIIGQVKKPGYYYFYDGMKLTDLIDLAGGFKDTTFWKSIYQNRGELVRRNPDTRYETVIEVKLDELILNKNDIRLQNLDRFVVHANVNFFEKKNVQILGEVHIPGSYPLIKDNETLQEFLARAGGLTSKALNNGISIYRENNFFDTIEDNEELMASKTLETITLPAISINKRSRTRVAWQNNSIILMPGDSIVVREKTMTVNVTGEVYNPGLIEYRIGKPLRYYLNAAGGLTEGSNKHGIIVVYANGLVSPKKWYSSPKIEDGSTVIVNPAKVEQPFNLTQFATNWTSIISSVVTTVIISQQISSSN